MDSKTGLAHSAVVTSANVQDKHPLPDLMHGQEQRVYGDSAYASQGALIHSKAPQAHNFTNCRARKPGGEVDEVKRGKNRSKSKIKVGVEHVFAVIKRLEFYESALPWISQERWSRIYVAGIGEYLLVSESIDGTSPALVGEWLAKCPMNSPSAQKLNALNSSFFAVLRMFRDLRFENAVLVQRSLKSTATLDFIFVKFFSWLNISNLPIPTLVF